MENKEQKKTIKFNSFYDPIKVEPTDTNIKFINNDALGYNERGQVVIIKKPKRNFQEEIQSYEQDSLLSEQLKRIANGTQKPLEENYMDISEMPHDILGVMEKGKQLEEKTKKFTSEIGITTEELLKANDEEITKIINDYVKSKIKEPIEPIKEETKNVNTK